MTDRSSRRSSTSTRTPSSSASYPAPGARCRLTGPWSTPRTGARYCAPSFPPRSPSPVSIPPTSSASPPTSPPARSCRCSPTPLAETAEWAAHPHAWPKLWKHHAAQDQADRINALAHARGEKWISRYGGRSSAEWQYAKALQVLEEDPGVHAACARWIEAADWIAWQLTGVESRNACMAGYGGIFQDGGYPSEEHLGALHPGVADFARTRLEHPLAALGSRAGSPTARAAEWTGLPAGIAVAVGNVDAHVSAPAARAVENGQLLALMGTSTRHVVNGAALADVPGICGVVEAPSARGGQPRHQRLLDRRQPRGAVDARQPRGRLPQRLRRLPPETAHALRDRDDHRGSRRRPVRRPCPAGSQGTQRCSAAISTRHASVRTAVLARTGFRRLLPA